MLDLIPKCDDFIECSKCIGCFFYNEQCTYLDSDTQLWLSGGDEYM